MTGETHMPGLVHPIIRPFLERPDEIGTVLYDSMIISLQGKEEIKDPRIQLVEGGDVFIRFEERDEWEPSDNESSDTETVILSDSE